MGSTTNKQNLSKAALHYQHMSEGDKSCLVAMLLNSGAQQATSIGSAHDKFYEELSKLGFATQAGIPSSAGQLTSIRSWCLTPVGVASMPTLLLALDTTVLRNGLQNNCFNECAKFGLKLSVVYTFCQLLAFAFGYLIKHLEISVSLIRKELSVAVVFFSLMVSLYLATKIWRHKNKLEERVKNIAYSEFLMANTKSLSVVIALLIITIHLLFEFIGTYWGWLSTPKSIVKLLFQTAVLGGVTGWISLIFFPGILRSHHKKQFRAKKSKT
ncbi:hypothetical protein PsAD37_05485 [Pseudovibrio sp. Ad37]|nr:hypothetical protein PsAD37_05485 [Pseudovibrio sp. Ad37]